MSKNNTSLMQKLVSAFIIWCMVAMSILGLVAQVGGSDQAQPVPAEIIPAIIDDEIIIRDHGVYDADYSIDIQVGGTLKLVNTTLNFLQDEATEYNLTLSKGSLILENSTITTAASEQAAWNPFFVMNLTDGNFTMSEHSVLAFPGWLNVTNTRTDICDSWITSVYPDTLFTSYAEDFPTFTDVMENVPIDWSTLLLGAEDFEDDCPIMKFHNCDNVTISDSLIEKLYEDEDLDSSIPFNESFAPSAATANAGDVDSLLYQDFDYMEVWASPAQTFDVDSFNTAEYTDSNYQVNDVWVHAIYNTSWDGGISGYNGTDYFTWKLDSAGAYTNLFMLGLNTPAPPWAENYSAALNPTPTLTQIATLDLQFINNDVDVAGAVYFDQIELIVELERNYTTYPTMISVNNTELTIINSQIDVDWLSFTDDFQIHNCFDIVNGSNMYLLNVSIDEDDGGQPGTRDFLEIPDGTPKSEYINYLPFRTESDCEVYYFKWAEVAVTDKYGSAMPGVKINATYDFNHDYTVNNVSWVNNLNTSEYTSKQKDWNHSKIRTLDYLNKMYGVSNTTYNITGTNGRAMIPLLTTYFNDTNWPGGMHVGNYEINATYDNGTVTSYGHEELDFSPYPNTQPEDNSVIVPIAFSDVTYPRPWYAAGLIVNDTNTPHLKDGGTTEDMSISNFIIVEDSGTLTISNADLSMRHSDNAPFEIIVRDTAELIFDNVDIDTLSNEPITITVCDEATLTMTDVTTTSVIDIVATGSSDINFNRTDIAGNFDVVGWDSDVDVNAVDTVFSKSLDDLEGGADVTLIGCSSPISPNFYIWPSNTSKVWVYRWIDITVYDGVTPANTLQGANIVLTTDLLNPPATIATKLNRAGATDATGHYLATGLSDYIWFDPIAGDEGEVSPFACGGYDLNVQYQLNAGTPNHLYNDAVGLSTYPAMSANDAIYGDNVNKNLGIEINGEIVLENVLPDLDPPITVWPMGANASVGRGDMVFINTTINNTGDAEAHDIDVWINDTFEEVVLETFHFEIEELEPGEHENISFEHKWDSIDDLGVHNLTVTVDPLDDILEGNEDNNIGWTEVNITSQPDLAIQWYYDVSASEAYPLNNTDFEIMVDVWNLGDVNATDVMVSFYDDVNGYLGNVTIGNIEPNPDVPSVASLTVNYDANGVYFIYVAIDEADLISEVDETNNNNSEWPWRLQIWENPDLNIDVLDIIEGINPIDYGLGGGVPVTECNNRTMVTLRARVWNIGELHASNVNVQFWDGTQNIGTTSIVSSIIQGNYEYMMFTWEATTAGSPHNLRAIAYATGLTSNEGTQTLTVNDDRPDIALTNISLSYDVAELTDSQDFDVNVSLANNGISTASDIGIHIYSSESMWQSTQILQDLGLNQYMGRIGNYTVSTLAGGNSRTVTVPCEGLDDGPYDLFIYADTELNTTDQVTYNGVDYNLYGDIEESNEINNNGTLAITVVMPELMVSLVTPAMPDNSWGIGETSEILVTGNVVRVDNPNVGVSGVFVDIGIDDQGDPITVETGSGGLFTIGLTAPDTEGNYTVTVTGAGVASANAWFVIEEAGLDLMLWIIIIVLVVVAVIVGITLYLYFVGLGKTVQCGECGAFIPEGAKKCPKCGVEFEDEVAKCSVCGSWVPIDVKNCPDCGTEFTVGTEDLDDYEAKMKRQYDDIVRKFKQDAKEELGAEFTETEFQAWWATQATFITFDQWLQEEEEMKRMGSKPCHNCGTENSVTAKICHKCGTVMEGVEEELPEKPEGKMPVEKKAAETPKEAPTPEPVPAAAPEPADKKPAEAAENEKKCPSCGMEVGISENSCPICNYEFDKAEKEPPATPPPSGGEGASPAPVKRVVKKPVKRVVKRPVQKEGE